MSRPLLVDLANVVRRFAFAMLGERQAEPAPADIDRVLDAVEVALRTCAREIGCQRAILAVDAEGVTWRAALYPGYKANRPTGGYYWTLTAAARYAFDGWRCVESSGFEADDVIAALAHRIAAVGRGPCILSSDSDLLALAGWPAEVYQFGQKGEPRFVERNRAWIRERYGLPDYDLLPLYKALVGEPSDNLPGVRGMGPKKAVALLRLFRSAPEIVESGVFGKERREQFQLMLQLVSLRLDVPIDPIDPATCAIPHASA